MGTCRLTSSLTVAGSYLVKAGLALPFHWLGGDMAMEIGGAVMQFLYGPAMTVKLYAARVMRTGQAASEGQQGMRRMDWRAWQALVCLCEFAPCFWDALPLDSVHPTSSGVCVVRPQTSSTLGTSPTSPRRCQRTV